MRNLNKNEKNIQFYAFVHKVIPLYPEIQICDQIPVFEIIRFL